MKVEYTGRHITLSDKLKQQADEGLARIAKLVDSSASAHVILSTDKYRQIAEITISTRTQEFVATCEADELETALHDTLQTIERQIVRHKQKRITTKRHPHVDTPGVLAVEEGVTSEIEPQ